MKLFSLYNPIIIIVIIYLFCNFVPQITSEPGGWNGN